MSGVRICFRRMAAMSNHCSECHADDDSPHYPSCSSYRPPTAQEFADADDRIGALEQLIEPLRPILERYSEEAEDGEEFGTWLAKNSVIHWSPDRKFCPPALSVQSSPNGKNGTAWTTCSGSGRRSCGGCGVSCRRIGGHYSAPYPAPGSGCVNYRSVSSTASGGTRPGHWMPRSLGLRCQGCAICNRTRTGSRMKSATSLLGTRPW